MSAHDEAVEEAEARQDEQIDEQRIVEAEGWLRDALCWFRKRNISPAVATVLIVKDATDQTYHRSRYQPLATAAYDVLGLSGVLRALARFVEEEERAK